ncbi:MAG: hypothetical protein JWL64_159 [Frankiales bacterium]|nr:hypothetical protein [Frankiales bacterium]
MGQDEHDVAEAGEDGGSYLVRCVCGWQADRGRSEEQAMKDFAAHAREQESAGFDDLGVAAPGVNREGQGRVGGGG